jgi:hypothetical protein
MNSFLSDPKMRIWLHFVKVKNIENFLHANAEAASLERALRSDHWQRDRSKFAGLFPGTVAFLNPTLDKPLSAFVH